MKPHLVFNLESYEQNNPPDIAISEIISSLNEIFPSINKNDLNFLYHGSYNVYEYKNTYIFKFLSKTTQKITGSILIKKEFEKLQALKKVVSFNIPNPVYFSFNSKVPFYGYKKIPGSSLSKNIIKYSNKDKFKIAKEIGLILTELHSLDPRITTLHKVFSKNCLSENSKNYWNNFYQKIQLIVFPQLNIKEKEWVKDLFNSFLNNESHFNYRPVIAHNDFDTSNILVDQNKAITGIIDFEETAVGDPSIDLAFLDEGLDFFNIIIQNYHGIKDESFKSRILFHHKKRCLFYLLTGIEHNLQDMVLYGKKWLQLVINEKITL